MGSQSRRRACHADRAWRPSRSPAHAARARRNGARRRDRCRCCHPGCGAPLRRALGQLSGRRGRRDYRGRMCRSGSVRLGPAASSISRTRTVIRDLDSRSRRAGDDRHRGRPRSNRRRSNRGPIGGDSQAAASSSSRARPAFKPKPGLSPAARTQGKPPPSAARLQPPPRGLPTPTAFDTLDTGVRDYEQTHDPADIPATYMQAVETWAERGSRFEHAAHAPQPFALSDDSRHPDPRARRLPPCSRNATLARAVALEMRRGNADTDRRCSSIRRRRIRFAQSFSPASGCSGAVGRIRARCLFPATSTWSRSAFCGAGSRSSGRPLC